MAIVAAGCGSPSEAPAAAGQGGFEVYIACLAENGVTLAQNGAGAGQRTPGAFPSGAPSGRPSGRPSGAPGGPGGGFGGGFGSQAPDGVDQATWKSAQAACESVRPTAGPDGGLGGNGANDSALAAYRNCLSEHGVTASTPPDQLDNTDPTVAAAMTACAVLRPDTQPTPAPSS